MFPSYLFPCYKSHVERVMMFLLARACVRMLLGPVFSFEPSSLLTFGFQCAVREVIVQALFDDERIRAG